MAFWNFSKKQEPVAPQPSKLVGIDLGYGQIKIFSDGQKEKFISAVGTPISTFTRSTVPVTKQDMLDSLHIDFNGQTYYVGKNAIVNTRNGRMTLRQNKAASEHNIVKFIVGLTLLMEEDQEYQEFDVVTGLPVLEYKNELDSLRAAMYNGGRPFEFTMYFGPKVVKKKIKINQVIVISQGEGAFYDFVLDQDGDILEDRAQLVSGKTMVVDIGYRTTDIVTMENGRYIEPLSDQLNKGVNSMHQEVLRLIMDRHSIKKELTDMDAIVRNGEVYHNTKTINVTKVVDDVAMPFGEDIVENLHTISNDQLGSIEQVIMTGGGSSIVYPWVKANLQGVTQVSCMNEAEFCNASGYYKYGLLLKNNGQME